MDCMSARIPREKRLLGKGGHKPGGFGAIRGELKSWVGPPSAAARIQSGSVELSGISISKRLKKYFADQ